MSTEVDERRVFNIGVVKAAPDSDERAIEQSFGTTDPERDFYNIISAGADDDREIMIGENATYALKLTPAEAAELVEYEHVRFVEEPEEAYPHYAGNPNALNVPRDETWAWMRARYPAFPERNGQDVLFAVLDQGTTQAVRDYMGWTLVERRIFGDIPPNGQELHRNAADSTKWENHGCLVAPNCVPFNGRLLDYMVISADGRSLDTYFAAAVRAACDAGCRFINFSFGSPPTENQTLSSTYSDAFQYAKDANALVFISMGNDATAGMGNPAFASKTFTNVISVMNFDEDTDTKSSSSNYDAAATCCAPGNNITSLTVEALITLWSGTSAATPLTCQACGRCATRGLYTPMQILAALKNNLRDTGQPAAQQGGGAIDFQMMLNALQNNVTTANGNATLAPISTPSVLDARGFAGSGQRITMTVSVAMQADDLRLFVMATSSSVTVTPPAGWMLLREQVSNSQKIIVFARTVTPGEATGALFEFSGITNPYYTAQHFLIRTANGSVDPQRITLLAKFYDSSTATSLSTPSLPVRTTADQELAFYWHRDINTANAGSLTAPSGSNNINGYFRTTATVGYQSLSVVRPLSSGARTTPLTSTPDAADSGGGALSIILPGPLPYTAPVAVRRQLCSNPSLDVDASGHSISFTRSGVTSSSLSIATSLARPFPESAAYGYVNITAPDSNQTTSDCDINLPTFPVTAGLSYAVSTYLRFSVANGRYLLYLRFDNSSGTKVGDTGTTPLVTLASTTVWTRASKIMVAPAGAVICKPQLWFYSVGDNTVRSFRWDCTLYEQSTTVGDYFDGVFQFANWAGSAHASESVSREDWRGKQFAAGAVLL